MNKSILHIEPFRASLNGHRVDARLSHNEVNYNIYCSTDDCQLTPSNESLAALAYPRCMKERLDIEMAPLDQTFKNGLNTIHRFFTQWGDDYYLPKILETQTNTEQEPTKPPSNKVGCFFSGGLDSLYTFLENKDEITHLVFVHGFDIKLDNHDLRTKTSKAIRYIAKEFGKEVIEIETNLRDVFYRSAVNWGSEGHGAALACIGHLLCPLLPKIFIPASYTEQDHFKWGSHPELDKYWGSSTLSFDHHGTIERPEKAALIAQHDNVMKTIRVCWKNTEGTYNCGECEKCIRTMINFMAVGALAKCESFERKISNQEIKKLLAGDKKSRLFFESNLRALQKYNSDNIDTQEALEYVLNRSPRFEAFLRYLQRRKKQWGRLLGLSKRTHR